MYYYNYLVCPSLHLQNLTHTNCRSIYFFHANEKIKGFCFYDGPTVVDNPQVQGIATVFKEVKPKFIDSTQGEPKNTYKP